jgi:actin-related protein
VGDDALNEKLCKGAGSNSARVASLLRLRRPVVRGAVEDWGALEHVLHHAFERMRRRVDGEWVPRAVLLVEPPLAPLAQRERLVRLLFDTFGVPAVAVGCSASLALFSSSHSTGVVVEIGEAATHVVPVLDGFVLRQAVRRLDVGGRRLTARLAELMSRSWSDLPPGDAERAALDAMRVGWPLSPADERLFWRPPPSAFHEHLRRDAGQHTPPPLSFLDVKERLVAVAKAAGPRAEQPRAKALWPGPRLGGSHYTGSGHEFSLGDERFEVGEALFQPELLPELAGTRAKGLHHLVLEAVLACDVDARKELTDCVLLAGGGGALGGLQARLHAELKELLPERHRLRVKRGDDAVEALGGGHAPWLGGQFVAPLLPREAWLTRAQYEREGITASSHRGPFSALS